MQFTKFTNDNLEELREKWEALILTDKKYNPMTSYSWYKTWVDATRSEAYVLATENTIAAFIKTGNTLLFKHRFSDFNDLVGDKSIWGEIIEYVKNDGIGELDLQRIPEDSASLDFFNKLSQENPMCEVKVVNVAPYLELPATFEEYLASIREKRKKYNRFIREIPEYKVEETTDLTATMESLIELMMKNPIKKASYTQEKGNFFRNIVLACKETKMYTLHIGEELVAAQVVFENQGSARLFISGYDLDKYQNTGTFLIMDSIRIYIEKGYEIFDFLLGSESYKYELGAKDFNLYEVKLKF